MKLITKQQREQMLRNGRANADAHGSLDFLPVVKLFTPDAGCTWLLTELDPEDPDIAFGLCDLGLGFPELGSVRLSEIASVRGKIGLPPERDLWFEAAYPISVYARGLLPRRDHAGRLHAPLRPVRHCERESGAVMTRTFTAEDVERLLRVADRFLADREVRAHPGGIDKDYAGRGEWQAIRPLLATAPTMLEALKAQDMAEADPAAARRKGYFDLARELREAALAKATGGAS